MSPSQFRCQMIKSLTVEAVHLSLGDKMFYLIVTAVTNESTTLKFDSIHAAKSAGGSLFRMSVIKSVFVQSVTTKRTWLYKVKDENGREIVEKTIAPPSPHPIRKTG